MNRSKILIALCLMALTVAMAVYAHDYQPPRCQGNFNRLTRVQAEITIVGRTGKESGSFFDVFVENRDKITFASAPAVGSGVAWGPGHTERVNLQILHPGQSPDVVKRSKYRIRFTGLRDKKDEVRYRGRFIFTYDDNCVLYSQPFEHKLSARRGRVDDNKERIGTLSGDGYTFKY